MNNDVKTMELALKIMKPMISQSSCNFIDRSIYDFNGSNKLFEEILKENLIIFKNAVTFKLLYDLEKYHETLLHFHLDSGIQKILDEILYKIRKDFSI